MVIPPHRNYVSSNESIISCNSKKSIFCLASCFLAPIPISTSQLVNQIEHSNCIGNRDRSCCLPCWLIFKKIGFYFSKQLHLKCVITTQFYQKNRLHLGQYPKNSCCTILLTLVILCPSALLPASGSHRRPAPSPAPAPWIPPKPAGGAFPSLRSRRAKMRTRGFSLTRLFSMLWLSKIPNAS